MSDLVVRRKHSMIRFVYRYVSGRPMDGRTGWPYLSSGPGRWPGWKRQAWRLGVPAAGWIVVHYPAQVATATGITAAAVAWRARQRWL